MLKEVKDLIGTEGKDVIRSIFVVAKSQVETQLKQSRDALTQVLDSNELGVDEQEVFTELDRNLDATALSFNKVLDLIIQKIDDEPLEQVG